MGVHRDPAAAAQEMLRRMPSVPTDVTARIVAARMQGPFERRGFINPLERFFETCAAAGRIPERAEPRDFGRAADGRHQLRSLLWALRTFAPDLPLAAARTVSAKWDRKLNEKYNKKPRRPRKRACVGLPPEAWPAAWRQTLPQLEIPLRRPGQPSLRPLRGKTRENALGAMGMLAAARLWASNRGVEVGDRFDGELFSIFARYLIHERGVTARTVADYLERIGMLARRCQLLDAGGEEYLAEAIRAARDAQADAPDPKVARVRAFTDKFDLGDVLLRADALARQAAAMPGHSAGAARKRLKAMVLALLVNGADRNGDLLLYNIGAEIFRRPDGLWCLARRQGKTGALKEDPALWLLTSRLVDAHLLGDRPVWLIWDRVMALNGMNLLSARDHVFNEDYPSTLLKEEFGVSGHLVRSLITDSVRRLRPDAAWAVKALLGHTSLTMQQAYLSDFRFTAAMQKYHKVIEEAAR